MSETDSEVNKHGKKRDTVEKEKDGWQGRGGVYSVPSFIFNCSLQFFMVMSPPPSFQNNRLSVFASMAAFHFRGLFLKRSLL